MNTPSLERDTDATNRTFYDALWSRAHLTSPDRFNTWPLLSQLSTTRPRRIELGPGLHPRLPLEGSWFVDASRIAVNELQRAGARAQCADATSLPFGEMTFDLACAFDVIEHVADDEALLEQLSRVVSPGGTLVLSVPLHPHRWTAFDEIVGHVRRYEPRALVRVLARHGFVLERSAPFGMKPRDSVMTHIALWQMRKHFARAMEIYNRWLMPIALWRQKPLDFVHGAEAATRCDDVVVVCRREKNRLAGAA